MFIGGPKLYDLRSVRCSIEVTNGLDPVCDGFLEVWLGLAIAVATPPHP